MFKKITGFFRKCANNIINYVVDFTVNIIFKVNYVIMFIGQQPKKTEKIVDSPITITGMVYCDNTSYLPDIVPEVDILNVEKYLRYYLYDHDRNEDQDSLTNQYKRTKFIHNLYVYYTYQGFGYVIPLKELSYVNNVVKKTKEPKVLAAEAYYKSSEDDLILKENYISILKEYMGPYNDLYKDNADVVPLKDNVLFKDLIKVKYLTTKGIWEEIPIMTVEQDHT
jgi:hypothetical protein